MSRTIIMINYHRQLSLSFLRFLCTSGLTHQPLFT